MVAFARRFSVACRRVSLLETFLGCAREIWRECEGTKETLARGVWGSASSNQPASSLDVEPLSEECSLLSPSLSQWRFS